jgi:hypothetical protein
MHSTGECRHGGLTGNRCSLLRDIHQFVQKEQERNFLQSLVHCSSRIADIEGFYRRIETTISAFQVRD